MSLLKLIQSPFFKSAVVAINFLLVLYVYVFFHGTKIKYFSGIRFKKMSFFSHL